MNALCNIVNDETTGTAKQYITITYNSTTVEYTVIRDLSTGGDITKVKKHFQNLPYIETGQKTYDKDLTVLDYLFKAYNETYKDIDILLWEMEENETTAADVVINDIDMEKQIEINITLIENSLY